MFAKLAVIVVAMGIFAATLLSFRQNRLQVASELTQTQLRIQKSDDNLWLLRARIAAKVAPASVEQLAADVGPLRPLALPAVARTQPQAEHDTVKVAETKKSRSPQ
jgi:hypothetical protein